MSGSPSTLLRLSEKRVSISTARSSLRPLLVKSVTTLNFCSRASLCDETLSSPLMKLQHKTPPLEQVGSSDAYHCSKRSEGPIRVL